LHEITFERFWERKERNDRIRNYFKSKAFTLPEYIARNCLSALEQEKSENWEFWEMGGRVYEEEVKILEETISECLEKWEKGEQHRSSFEFFQYSQKSPGSNWGPEMAQVFKRRLNYYHLNKIEFWSRNEIMSGEFFPSSLPLP
jgi:hypothetical protein